MILIFFQTFSFFLSTFSNFFVLILYNIDQLFFIVKQIYHFFFTFIKKNNDFDENPTWNTYIWPKKSR